ncbi:FAD-dependent oxidoreductase [Roseomonas sp. 18066]|uniref:FAD-dependent oxidoreductase n=1 Tax=Roseomonas sp. 18066 TaxID=2681412 RepID=UPI00135B58B6|nr:FAD-dependent oxidoreductase [Roseomonas sp. 18066]
MPDHDLAIIGAGAAGLSVAAQAAALGLKVALFERAPPAGATLPGGAVAVAALLAAAHRAAGLRDSARFGLSAGPVALDWAGLQAHLRRAVAEAAPPASATALQRHGVTLVAASAHFTAPDRIEAGGRIHSFRRAVIAAGTAPVLPDLPGMVGLPWLTEDSLLSLEALPAHLLVLGGSARGVELAQAFARLGGRVTLIVPRPALLEAEEPELRQPLREALRADGVEILENSPVVALEAAAAGLAAVVEGGARIAGSHLLFALGQAPRLAPLDLAAGGIRATAQGIATDAGLRSLTNRRVWAAGDIADPEGLRPGLAAGAQAAVIARGMLFRLPARLDAAASPRAIGTVPALAQIGMTEAEARAVGHDPRILRQAFAGNDQAIAEGATAGMVRLVVDARGRLLGAGILGQGAAELAAPLSLAIGRRLPLSALSELALPLPGRAEAAVRAAQSSAGSIYPATPFGGKLAPAWARRLAGWLRHLP